MCAEVWMMSRDRDKHDADQTQAAKDEAAHFQMIANGMQRDFDATMRQFTGQASNLTDLKQKASRLSQQISATPLSSMSPQELAQKARAVAKQMRAYLQSYEDNEKGIGFTEGRAWPQNKTKQKRTELRNAYEADAKRIISTGNRLRAEMVKRLPPSDRLQEDRTRAGWFENPPAGKIIGLLYQNVNYLDRLADRMEAASTYAE
jgi:hypothetical protein